MAKLKRIMCAKGGFLPRYAGGGALPWGEIIDTGNQVGSTIKGGGADTTKDYFGNWARPTHSNIIDSFQSGDINEIGDNVFLGGLFGFSARRQSKEAREAHQQQLDAEQQHYIGLGDQRFLGYDTTGSSEQSSMYALGGNLQPLNSDTVEVDGRTHAEGGVQIPEVGAEVEDKETIANGYVFSDQLGFADKHKAIAKQIGKIEQKPTNPERTNSLTILRGKEAALKRAQEMVRTAMFDSQNGTMYPGGKRKYDDGGYLGDAPPVTGARLTEGIQAGNFAVPDMPQPTTPDYSGTYSNGPSYISNKDWQQTQGNGFNWGQAINGVAPYVSNALNAARRLPMPATPLREPGVKAQLVDYSADKNELDRQTRSINKSIRQATSNPSIANAVTASNLGSYLDAKARLSQTERNTNAQILNQTGQFNAGINARNTARYADYRDNLVSRLLAQQNLSLENSADIGNKYQQQQRDRAMMNLENRKLDVLPVLYKDTGVVDRNMTNLIEKERYPQIDGGSFAHGGSIHIDPSKRGTFTSAATKHGMGVQAFASKVLANKGNYSTKMVKKANFARNFAH